MEVFEKATALMRHELPGMAHMLYDDEEDNAGSAFDSLCSLQGPTTGSRGTRRRQTSINMETGNQKQLE